MGSSASTQSLHRCDSAKLRSHRALRVLFSSSPALLAPRRVHLLDRAADLQDPDQLQVGDDALDDALADLLAKERGGVSAGGHDLRIGAEEVGVALGGVLD